MRGAVAATALAVALMTTAGPVRAADQPTADPEGVAARLLEAQKAGRMFPRVDPALDDPALYEIQKRYVDLRLKGGEDIAGYKGGFIPKASVGGVLLGSGMREAGITPAVVRRGDFRNLLVEAEVAFEFCERVAGELPDVEALRGAVCALRPAIELPDLAIEDAAALVKDDFPTLRKNLIATNVAASHVLLGESTKPEEVDLDRLTVRTVHDGEELGRRDGGHGGDSLWDWVLWVVNDFVIPQGYVIEPGDIIIPGNLTGLHPGRPGTYEVDFGRLGTIAFEVTP